MRRALSYSEVSSAMQCLAAWDFGYGGHLAGTALRAKDTAPVLMDGKAFGAAAAAYHATEGMFGLWEAHEALNNSYDADAGRMQEFGVLDTEALVGAQARMGGIVDHYATITEPLPGKLTRLEETIEVPIPSRVGKRRSTRYRYVCRIDGYTSSATEGRWLVEFKLRSRLRPVQIIEREPQLRWYAWALLHDRLGEPSGVIVETRLNDLPRPARRLKNGGVSHAVTQITTPESYLAACEAVGDEPHPEALEAFAARVWNQRVVIQFRPGELREAAQQLVGAAQMIRDLDSGVLAPMRIADPRMCNGCRFNQICSNPGDERFVDSLFERIPAKRNRQED